MTTGRECEKADEQDAAVTSRRTRFAATRCRLLAEALTSPDNPLTSEQLRELQATGMYFPQLRLAIEKTDRSFSDTADLRKAILLAGAVQILNLLIE